MTHLLFSAVLSRASAPLDCRRQVAIPTTRVLPSWVFFQFTFPVTPVRSIRREQ